MFHRILIANRGEIACRIIATCRRLGVETVAVYSEADANARHVRLADQAIGVGPAAARDSYLRMDRIIEAAQRSGAQAIHPGYGFLSENPEFALRVAEAGLTFIGPTVEAMRAMSSKATAKQLMERSGVPLLPGYHGDDQDASVLRREAERIGYPVLIKATAGGGGKGMRVVENAGQFDERLASCQREAKGSFGDARVLLEKFLLRPRHIEVQIFGDTHGQVVHLFERDCSSQRRHQKVLEEALAPHLGPEQRESVTRAACSAARAVGYVGAGTVEFLFDPGVGFYFMEMNTRIQVEHPVTEMITGLDLVEWQLRVAVGEPLPKSQADISSSGHAIEVRLYAEVPESGFLPSSGTIKLFDLPVRAPGVRIESGIEAGDAVGIDYDPMLAKLIVHADSRPEAVALLLRALSEVRIGGVGNNVAFLRRLAASPEFARGEVDIGFIERTPSIVHGAQLAPEPRALAAAALWVLTHETWMARGDADGVWARNDGWRLNAHLIRTLQFETGTAQPALATVFIHYAPGAVRVAVGDPAAAVPASLQAEGEGLFHLLFGAEGARVRVAPDGEYLRLGVGDAEYRLRWRDPRQPVVEGYLADSGLAAPMPGRIIAHVVAAGNTVSRGAPLLIMEAMKMEHTICAPANGVVRAYLAAVGQQVREGTELIDFEAQQ
ncbi:MAG TPA: acetyl/propionyl/methylcrotonyl-CoA carboxylase subunit alpha [Steroidobacteraceae bacterium]|nr:acetyl/propionyl/methylcrotonyl-CoA carboxylase subunit alpha [Steroidobacteraceae bacterium]